MRGPAVRPVPSRPVPPAPLSPLGAGGPRRPLRRRSQAEPFQVRPVPVPLAEPVPFPGRQSSSCRDSFSRLGSMAEPSEPPRAHRALLGCTGDGTGGLRQDRSAPRRLARFGATERVSGGGAGGGERGGAGPGAVGGGEGRPEGEGAAGPDRSRIQSRGSRDSRGSELPAPPEPPGRSPQHSPVPEQPPPAAPAAVCAAPPLCLLQLGRSQPGPRRGPRGCEAAPSAAASGAAGIRPGLTPVPPFPEPSLSSCHLVPVPFLSCPLLFPPSRSSPSPSLSHPHPGSPVVPALIPVPILVSVPLPASPVPPDPIPVAVPIPIHVPHLFQPCLHPFLYPFPFLSYLYHYLCPCSQPILVPSLSFPVPISIPSPL